MANRDAILAVMAMLTLVACKDNSDAAAPMIRDSAGIEIVDNVPPADTLPRYLIDSVPTIEIGSGVNDTTDLLGHPSAPVKLADGRILFVDGSQNDVWVAVYGPDGKRRPNWSRSGDGPGEYRYPQIMGIVSGDSVVFYDAAKQAFLIYDSRGKFGRMVRWIPVPIPRPALDSTFNFAGSGGSSSPIGVSPDYRVISLVGAPTPQQKSAGTYRLRDTAFVFVQELGDSAARRIGVTPNNEVLVHVTGGGGMSSLSPLFPARSTVVVLDGLVAFGDNTSFDITVVKADGSQVRRIRRRVPRRSVSEADVQLAKNAEFARAKIVEIQAMVRAALDKGPTPDSMPAYDTFLASTRGELWVREYDPQGTKPTISRYQIFDATGRWVGHVDLPIEFEPSWIGPNAILGRWTGEDDVVRIREFWMRPRVTEHALLGAGDQSR